jgi:hypothetical protein
MTEAHNPAPRPNRRHRTAIPGTCAQHRGPIGFANLLVSLHGRSVVFDPHVTGQCLITINEDAAKTLRDILTHWLG